MGWWLVLGHAQPRQVPSEVVPTQNHTGGRAVGLHYWGPAAGDSGLGALPARLLTLGFWLLVITRETFSPCLTIPLAGCPMRPSSWKLC